MIGNDVAELFLELGQQFLDCEVQNEEGLIAKTGTGNGVHAPVNQHNRCFQVKFGRSLRKTHQLNPKSPVFNDAKSILFNKIGYFNSNLTALFEKTIL